jgi:hypothetical protein
VTDSSTPRGERHPLTAIDVAMTYSENKHRHDPPAEPRHTADTITDDALDRLYKQLAEARAGNRLLGDSVNRWAADAAALRTRAERAEAALDRVRALHRPAEGLGYDSDEDDTPGSYGHIAQACTTCGTTDEYAVRWPCGTLRALDEPKEPRP